MAHAESLWPQLAVLPLVVESCGRAEALPDALPAAGLLPRRLITLRVKGECR